ncbi:MAG: hypothetical protein Q9227_008664 [Pyrenula ochraceoflavens]
MGSRYGGDYRSPPPGGYGGGGRWDADRFARESRGPPVMERERERYYDDYPPRSPARFREPPRVDERIIFEERERYAPPRRPERRYYEEEEIDYRRPPSGAMVPYRREEPPPPRPGLLRRQSSLDFYDRKPMRRYDQYDRQEPYRIPVPLPPRRPSPPRYSIPEREFEEIHIAEPDYYGDEHYRNIREREWTTSRSRHRSRSSSASEKVKEEEEFVEVEKPFPRKGKTKMPKRLVHTRAIIELGYPYEEEGNTIIIGKALGKENIDEVVTLSKTYRERDEAEMSEFVWVSSEPAAKPRAETTTYVFEREKSPQKAETVIEERISHVPMSEAPRSVREWDTLKVEEVDKASRRSKSVSRQRSPSPTATLKSHKSHHTHHSHHTRSRSHVSKSRRSSSPGTVEEVLEKRTEIREISPSRTVRTSRSRRPSSPVEVVERRERVVEDDIGESNSVHAGPLALVVPERSRKSDREIEYEIRSLERERKALRAERHAEHRVVRSGEREVIIERESPETIEVRKDKKGRMSLVVPK